MYIYLDTITSSITNEPYDNTFHLSTPIKDASTINLKTLEIPLNLANIRDGLNTLSVKLSDNSIYTITLTNNFYADINSIVSEINSKFVTVGLPSGVTIVSSVLASNQVLLTLTDNNKIINSFQVLNTNFALYILGFKNAVINSTNYNTTTGICSLTAKLPYNLQLDTYIYVRISNVRTGTQHNTNQTFNNMSFKIPLNATSGMVYYITDEVSFKQSLSINSNDTYTFLTIQLLDRFGNVLSSSNGSNYDYSLTLEVY